jgi:hypothetical protein
MTWPNLETVRISLSISLPLLGEASRLKVLDLCYLSGTGILNHFAGAKDLRIFRLGRFIERVHPREIIRLTRNIIGPAVRSQSLAAVSLSGVGNCGGSLRKYRWLAGCPSIRILELNAWGYWGDPNEPFDMDELANFLNSFPKLEVVAFGIGNWLAAQTGPDMRQLCAAMERIMAVGRVKRFAVSEDVNLGVLETPLKNMASNCGVAFDRDYKWADLVGLGEFGVLGDSPSVLDKAEAPPVHDEQGE